ncbi:MAG: hypothetical protein V4663_05935 [Bacteroidota bacterium]
MKTTKFKLSEVLVLNKELTDLLGEEISFNVKYWLNKLFAETSKEVECFDKIKNELIEKYGTVPKEGDPKQISTTDDNWNKFKTELETILAESIEISHGKFRFEDFEFKSANNYFGFAKLLEEPEPVSGL